MSDYQEKHEVKVQESVNGDHKDDQLIEEKSHNDTNVISVDTSQEFQHIDHSVSQQASSTFNHLESSQNTQDKQQKHQDQQMQREEEDQTQQIKPETSLQEKSAKVLEPKKEFKDETESEKFISVKIFENKINEALQFKNFGNEFFKTNQYNKAIEKYSEGLRILDPQQFYGATQAECQKMAEVSASLLFNIGSCFFNINSWKKAQIYYSQTISINPDHIKALYKRALCRYELENYDDAMVDIKLAFNKDKSNAEIHKSYEKIMEKYNQQVKKDKQNLKEMSSKMIRSDSQKSLSLSQSQIQQQKEEQKKVDAEQQKEKGSNYWNYVLPLLILSGIGFYSFKKWFGK